MKNSKKTGFQNNQVTNMSIKIPPTLSINEKDFHNAYARAIKYVLRLGAPMTIGDESNTKPIRDACITFELTGNAITQIENREIHPQFPFKHIDEYCETFTREYLKKYRELPPEDPKRFSYLYFERLAAYHGVLNQISNLKVNLANQIQTGISSNRHQSTTWIPSIDTHSKSSPCLQRIWVRWLGDDAIEVHLDWRSRDLYTAWQANLIAIIDMVNREIVHPNNCRIVKIIDHSDSCHVYNTDSGPESVNQVPTNPQSR